MNKKEIIKELKQIKNFLDIVFITNHIPTRDRSINNAHQLLVKLINK